MPNANHNRTVPTYAACCASGHCHMARDGGSRRLASLVMAINWLLAAESCT